MTHDAPRHRTGLSPDDYRELTGLDGDWRDSWWSDDFLALMVARWGIGEARDVLDVGCGVGHWGQRLMRHLPHARLTGVDAEASWMAEARERAQKLGLEASYRVGEAESLPFADASFDVVTCQTVLMHVADAVAVLREMRRVVRPGGTVIAAEPNNFANLAARVMARPELPFAVVRDLLELHHTLAAGKRALGEGDQSIGERLPYHFGRAGLTALRIATNPQTAPSRPPYDTPRGARDRALFTDWTGKGRLLELGGTLENARRMFLAAGGSEDRFEELRAVALMAQQATVDAYDSGTFTKAGGHLHYLVSGTRPAAPSGE